MVVSHCCNFFTKHDDTTWTMTVGSDFPSQHQLMDVDPITIKITIAGKNTPTLLGIVNKTFDGSDKDDCQMRLQN